MAINYAEKWSAKVDERFKIGPVTSAMVNQEYDWLGVEAVKVYSIPTTNMNDYALTGSNRYGTPAELQNNVQTLQLTQDRSFTFTIDRKSYDDTMMTMEAVKALRRQIDEVMIPEIDTYRIAAYVSGAETANILNAQAVTASNAYNLFLDAQEALDNGKVPQRGRFALVTPGYLNLLKLSPDFIKKGDMAQQVAFSGVVGEIDGVGIIKAPAAYFPAKTRCILAHRSVMVAPIKLQDYKLHQDPPGINGWLAEGRVRYDAFILNMKKDGISVIAEP